MSYFVLIQIWIKASKYNNFMEMACWEAKLAVEDGVYNVLAEYHHFFTLDRGQKAD